MNGRDQPTVWIFTDLYWPTHAGVAVTVDFTIETLRAAGYRVGLVAVGNAVGSAADDVIAVPAVNDLNYQGDQTAVFSALALTRKLRRSTSPADVFILATPGRLGLSGIGIGRLLNIRTILLHLTDFVAYTRYYSPARLVLTNAAKISFALMASAVARRRPLTRERSLVPHRGTVRGRVFFSRRRR
ncbi:glycosyltransferase family 1 protein [Fodinicola feengrottensis]|uniref:glycosyltransferase family 1 protein n=1 Tax=Fodinicola feengrottensis TaxID=435914 RepID=UPI0013D467E4|nr:glycosyltransferase family 1 protein [Fodinicola feengrottensis]